MIGAYCISALYVSSFYCWEGRINAPDGLNLILLLNNHQTFMATACVNALNGLLSFLLEKGVFR